jgi:hypothetical protein
MEFLPIGRMLRGDILFIIFYCGFFHLRASMSGFVLCEIAIYIKNSLCTVNSNGTHECCV